MLSYGWDEQYVRKRITSAKGWAYYFFAVAHTSANMMQKPQEPVDGYVAQQIERLKHGR